MAFINNSYVKDASVTDDTLNITVRKNGVETNVPFEGGDPEDFLKSITKDTLKITIKDEDDTDTVFYTLPFFDINQAGLVPQVNTLGTGINFVNVAAGSGNRR